ncbi:hypothetical protein K488DRAFT_73798 [Vararia minispora EC-137]|uniref:Uncharacterized protein n=1 Tax=Vararia minispora EC-137 TaxID=1314806 RepID=A0ACB8Q9L9_9AGAM|nr:hypothetical protein K488DRAFT_73798 [Vararia minispora EC-137]
MPVAKSALRAVKNVGRSNTPAQAAVRAATSNDGTPPTSAQLSALAAFASRPVDATDVLEVLDRRLNDKGKYWRHVYKSLVVLEHLLYTGSPAVGAYLRQNTHLITTLAEFQHIDDAGRDAGAAVRARAKELARLLRDPRTLEEARRRGGVQSRGEREGKEKGQGAPKLPPRPRRYQEEEEELARVLKLSEQEEVERQALLKAMQGDGLFDTPAEELIDLSEQPTLVPQPTVVPQATAVSQYTQYSVFQPQYNMHLSFQPSLQPQYTSLAPQHTLQSQHTAYSAFQPQYTSAYDPTSQQARYDALLQQQQQHAHAALQEQATASARWEQPRAQVVVGSNNPFAPAYASNNPFATTSSPFVIPSPPASAASFSSTSSSSSTSVSLSPSPRTPAADADAWRAQYSVATDYARTSPDFARPVHGRPFSAPDPDRLAKLERALNAGPRDDGADTFGNVGALRYGSTAHGRIAAQRTGPTSDAVEQTSRPLLRT